MKVKLFEHPPKRTVSEFAEENVVMTEGACKGQKFSYNSRPYFREPSDAMGDNIHNCRVVLMTPTQLGKTTAFLNYLFYTITYDPDNTLIILDSNKTADKLSKVRIRPFLKTQVKLESLQRGAQVDYDKSASTNNISLAAGKNILIGSARSPSDLCSFSCKYLLCDETSRYPEVLDKEGDPITLAMQRQETYHRSMAILTSTPTTEDCSINQHYLLGTQEVWCAICNCGHYMDVKYEDIDFTDIEHPTYTCKQCGEVFDEYTLQYKLKHAYAKPLNEHPYKDGMGRICRSFHISGTLVPERYTWKFLKEKELAARKTSLSAYMSFVNTSLGEVYYPGVDESLNVDILLRGRHYFTNDTIPKWVKFITCGVDTQDNRFELIVLGSNATRTKICFIERKVLLGDMNKPEVWNDLLNYLNNFTVITKDERQLKINITCIDSGGHHTQDVYAFCLKSPRLRPIKGVYGEYTKNSDIIYRVTDVGLRAYANGAGKIQLTLLNVNYAKDLIREKMLQIQNHHTTCNWVINSNIDAMFDVQFFNQMDAEYKEKGKNGNYKWVCKPGVRNEALDCTVYALAAVDIVRLMMGNAADVQTIEEDDIVDVEASKQSSNTSNELTVDNLLTEVKPSSKEETKKPKRKSNLRVL